MVQAKASGELTSLGVDLTNTNMHKEYLTHSKSQINFMVQDTEENNVPQWEPCVIVNDDSLAGAAIALCLLSPPTNNSNSEPFNNSHMKCYYDHTHGCLLDYFNDPILDDAMIYQGNISFQYKWEMAGIPSL